jgi:hypothetical protein
MAKQTRAATRATAARTSVQASTSARVTRSKARKKSGTKAKAPSPHRRKDRNDDSDSDVNNDDRDGSDDGNGDTDADTDENNGNDDGESCTKRTEEQKRNEKRRKRAKTVIKKSRELGEQTETTTLFMYRDPYTKEWDGVFHAVDGEEVPQDIRREVGSHIIYQVEFSSKSWQLEEVRRRGPRVRKRGRAKKIRDQGIGTATKRSDIRRHTIGRETRGEADRRELPRREPPDELPQPEFMNDLSENLDQAVEHVGNGSHLHMPQVHIVNATADLPSLTPGFPNDGLQDGDMWQDTQLGDATALPSDSMFIDSSCMWDEPWAESWDFYPPQAEEQAPHVPPQADELCSLANIGSIDVQGKPADEDKGEAVPPLQQPGDDQTSAQRIGAKEAAEFVRMFTGMLAKLEHCKQAWQVAASVTAR